MAFDQDAAVPTGQHQVLEAWHQRLRGRTFISYSDFDISMVRGELAYVSVLGCEGGRFRFRLAGHGLHHTFGGEAKGKTACEIDVCRGGEMWAELATRSILRSMPVSGMSRLPDGTLHYWLRLPMSSDGIEADLVLCHDRYLPAESLDDLDAAARRADKALRRDTRELVPA